MGTFSMFLRMCYDTAKYKYHFHFPFVYLPIENFQLEGKQTVDVPLSVTYNFLELNFGDSICAAKSAMLAHLKALNLDI